MADVLNARQIAMLAQQALDNQALLLARDEVREESVAQAIDNTLGPDADAMRFRARTMLEALALLEQKLRAMVDAGAAS